MDGAYLLIKSVDGERQVPIETLPITIGRNPQCTIVTTDGTMSKNHCVLEGTPEQLRVRDLGAANGVKINGRPVKEAELAYGDVLQLGRTQVFYVGPSLPDEEVLDLASEAAPATPAAPLPPRPAGSPVPAIQVPPPPPPPPEAEVILDVLPVEEEPPAKPQPAPVPLGRPPLKPVVRKSEPEEEIGAYELLGGDVGQVAEPQALPTSDPQQVLQQMADSMPDRAFDEQQITILNARGQVTHAAVAEARRRSGDAAYAFRMLLLICFRGRASDIHIEPKSDYFGIRIRVDGSMVDVVRVTKDLGVRLGAMIKVLCDLDMSLRNDIQEGHFSTRVPTTGQTRGPTIRRVDYRVSFAPTVFGQKLVIRILDSANAPLRISDLQLPPWMEEEISSTIELDSGMVLTVGPTGSGKTTSLYALLRSINVSDRNVITIEDPVEIQLEGVSQLPVDDQAGKSFSALLRSVLRQDPDVILVGEIRDPETARIALQAATTGHLVFSTLHTKDAVGTVFRLLDLGVEPYLVAQALSVVLAQRLVRNLCPYCRTPSKPTAYQAAKLEKALGQPVPQVYNAAGCARCLNTGFAGRRGIFELLSATDELRDVIMKNPTMVEIHKTLAASPFITLKTCGYQLVAEGLVPFDEVERAVGK